jgi:hypothetical protein
LPAQPQYTQPQYTQPLPAQPQYAQPLPAQPQYTSPQVHQQGHSPTKHQPGQYPPGQYPPGAPRRSGGRGCLVAVVVVVVLVMGLGLVGRWAMGRASAWFGSKTQDLVGGTGCPFATDAEVSALVGGGPVRLVRAGSLTSIVSSLVDSRVIPKAPSCWGISDGSAASVDRGRLLRIASVSDPAAPKVFRDEVTKAKGATVNKGDGVSVTGESYYNKAVTGLGDEAFCTSASTVGPGSAGVLVRKGERLVYVSLTPDFSQGAPGIGTPGRTTLASDDPSCALAQKIASAVLTH